MPTLTKRHARPYLMDPPRLGRGAPGRPRVRETPEITGPYGRELKAIRETLGLTQADFAAALGVRSDSLSRYERGQRQVPEPTIRLARYLLKAAPVGTL